MKKIYKYLCVSILSFIVLINNVFAAGYSVSTTSNSVTIGNSITLKISGSDIAGKFSISTSDSSIVSISSGNVWIDNNTQSITLKTNKVGSATITIKPTDVTSYSGDTITGNKTVKITVNAKPVNKPSSNNSGSSSGSSSNKPAKVKSSNSYLSSLTVDGYDLDNSFDKETLEYSVTVKEGTEKVKINAQLADSNAKVTGTGEVSVSEGLNTFNIIVTAENGSKRTYILKVNVKEYQPINVNIDKEVYTVVRKRKDLPKISEYFTEKEIIIGDDKVDGYYNEELGYDVDPKYDEHRTDIIQTITLNSEDNLVKFCGGIQFGSPVDSYVTPIPAPMDGYPHEEVMAGGSFISGSTIELSCDGPTIPPYIGYMQGGLTYEYGKLGILIAMNSIRNKDK